jgi:predicted nucleic acid-binding protein
MRLFLDTSVLVPALLEEHEFHHRAFGVLDRVQSGKDKGVMAAHSLAECYAVLTRLPGLFRHTPEQALLSIEENFLKVFEVAAMSAADYALTLRNAAASRIEGGTIYDALLLSCAARAKADRIFTFNLKHFQAVAPASLAKLLTTP